MNYFCSFEYKWKNTNHKSANCFLISCFKRNSILYVWARSLISVERRYNASYFFFISRLQNDCATTFICTIVWKMFMWTSYVFPAVSAIDAKLIIKGVSNILGIGYSFTIIKGEYSWYTRSYIFYRNKGFDSFLCVL